MKRPFFLLFAALTGVIPGAKIRAFPADHHQPDVATVSTARDSGPGSLRAAIESANRNRGTRIVFQIPTSDSGFEATQGRWRIRPLSALPTLKNPNTEIEGSGTIVISGDKANANWSGLRVEAGNCHIGGLKWSNWPRETISICASQTRIERNEFRDSPAGIGVQGPKSRRNRFAQNVFEGVRTPILFQDGPNDNIAAPSLSIVRDDAIAPVSHRFTLKFKGKANTNVTIELDYASDEARETPQIESVRDTHTLKTDAQGIAVWQFDWKGYPAGSWIANATQNGNTSAFSNTVVMPYL